MRAAPQRCRGQAMTEFVIGAVTFLLPVFLIVPVLGKYLDARATAVQAARYVAWERTVWYGGAAASVAWPAKVKSDTEIRNELRQRLFTEGTGITSGDKSNAGGGAKVLWTNRDGSGMTTGSGATVANNDSPGLANQVLSLIVTVADAIGPFTLEMKGYYNAGVTVGLNVLPINMSLQVDPALAFNPGTITMSERNVILANGWNANGSGHVKTQTQGLTPSSVFATDPVKTVFDILKGIMAAVSVQELWFLELGKIEPDVVPPDRLTK